MTPVEKRSTPAVRKDLGIERLDNELLILDKENGKIHRLNQAAALVWSGLSEGRCAQTIARDFVETFDINEELARKDVDRTLDELVSLELIEIAATPGQLEK